METAVVIGSGPNGLAASIVLVSAGYHTTIFERNSEIGGTCATGETTSGTEALTEILKQFPEARIMRYIQQDVAGVVAAHWGREQLTAREIEVLSLIRDGTKNKQIADQLGISETIVNFHIKISLRSSMPMTELMLSLWQSVGVFLKCKCGSRACLFDPARANV